MFERYTEKARRVIFFARYEASQFGSPYIETEHLLLGLLREDKALANRFLMYSTEFGLRSFERSDRQNVNANAATRQTPTPDMPQPTTRRLRGLA